MADLTYQEKSIVEKFLKMGSGYVLDFSDRGFQEFVAEAVHLDIYSEKYNYRSNSKANRLRAFIQLESNYVIGKLFTAFREYWQSKVYIGEVDYYKEEGLYKEYLRIAERLRQDIIVENLDAIQPNFSDRDFALLSRSIKESIEKNEPEAALDRLHTFVVKYVRNLCIKHNIEYSKSETLNSVFGKYVKYLLKGKLIESEMASKILKYSINIIEAFNDVRNDKSFAHDNQILNYHESVLIFNNISNAIKFIEVIEGVISKNKEIEDWSDLPF